MDPKTLPVPFQRVLLFNSDVRMVVGRLGWKWVGGGESNAVSAQQCTSVVDFFVFSLLWWWDEWCAGGVGGGVGGGGTRWVQEYGLRGTDVAHSKPETVAC